MANIIVPQFKNYKQEIILFKDIEDMTQLSIILPEPPNKRNVINHSRPQAKQKFERIKLPDSFQRFKTMDKEEIYRRLKKEEHKFIEDEYEKQENGHFFYNNGELTWLAGVNYLYLQWWKTNFGYPVHKESDRNVFYHWDKCCKDPLSAGMLEITRRRAGKSARAGAMVYHRTFSHSNRFAGIQSKTDKDAESFLKKNINYPWRNLPFFYQPIFDSSNDPSKELRFFTPTTSGKQAQAALGRGESLESWIEARSSVETAFDGEKLHTAVQDEAGKLVKVDMRERWRIIRPCLIDDRGRIIGKCIITTTVEEMEKKGGKQLKDIWDNSDPNPNRMEGGKKYLDEKGRTPSWLSRHFTPAYEGYIIDDYGNSLIEASKKDLEAQRKTTADKRMFPFTVRECFRNSGTECHFNVEILDARLEDFTFGNPKLAYGNFEWVDKDGNISKTPTPKVVFFPTTKIKGKFAVSYLFEKEEMSNIHFTRNGVKFPGNTSFGCAGGDPFKNNIVAGTKKSMGAGAVFRAHDSTIDPETKDVSQWETYRFVCTYANRPRTKDIYGDDMIKMCQYYGIKMNPEINVTFLWDHFVAQGYGGFLMYHRDNTGRLNTTPGENTMGDKVKDTLFDEINEYVEYHGLRDEHPELLEQFREVEYDMITKYDLFVASGYAKKGASKLIKNKKKQEDNNDSMLFHTFAITSSNEH